MIKLAVSEKLKTKITVFCMSVLQNAMVFGVGFPSWKTGGSRSFLGLRQYLQEKWPFFLSVKLSQPGFILFVSSYFVCIEEKNETKSGKN